MLSSRDKMKQIEQLAKVNEMECVNEEALFTSMCVLKLTAAGKECFCVLDLLTYQFELHCARAIAKGLQLEIFGDPCLPPEVMGDRPRFSALVVSVLKFLIDASQNSLLHLKATLVNASVNGFVLGFTFLFNSNETLSLASLQARYQSQDNPISLARSFALFLGGSLEVAEAEDPQLKIHLELPFASKTSQDEYIPMRKLNAYDTEKPKDCITRWAHLSPKITRAPDGIGTPSQPLSPARKKLERSPTQFLRLGKPGEGPSHDQAAAKADMLAKLRLEAKQKQASPKRSAFALAAEEPEYNSGLPGLVNPPRVPRLTKIPSSDEPISHMREAPGEGDRNRSEDNIVQGLQFLGERQSKNSSKEQLLRPQSEPHVEPESHASGYRSGVTVSAGEPAEAQPNAQGQEQAPQINAPRIQSASECGGPLKSQEGLMNCLVDNGGEEGKTDR